MSNDDLDDDTIRELARREPWYSAVRADCNDALSPQEPWRAWARDRLAQLLSKGGSR